MGIFASQNVNIADKGDYDTNGQIFARKTTCNAPWKIANTSRKFSVTRFISWSTEFDLSWSKQVTHFFLEGLIGILWLSRFLTLWKFGRSCQPPTSPYNTLPYKQETPSNPYNHGSQTPAWVPNPHWRVSRAAPLWQTDGQKILLPTPRSMLPAHHICSTPCFTIVNIGHESCTMYDIFTLYI